MPSGMPMASAMTIEKIASSNVTGSAAAVRSSTLVCAREEKPRLPVKMLPSHEKNCTTSGWSRP